MERIQVERQLGKERSIDSDYNDYIPIDDFINLGQGLKKEGSTHVHLWLFYEDLRIQGYNNSPETDEEYEARLELEEQKEILSEAKERAEYEKMKAKYG